MPAMPVRALSIWDNGPEPWRPVELRHLLDALPGSDRCSWRVEVEDLSGGVTANDVADAIERHRGGEPLVLDGSEMRRFAQDINQSFGGEFVAFAPGTSRDAVDLGLSTEAAFEMSPIRYVLLDIRGDEWIVITKVEADFESVRQSFRDVRDEDASREFWLG
jgi:hypothetical protein